MLLFLSRFFLVPFLFLSVVVVLVECWSESPVAVRSTSYDAPYLHTDDWLFGQTGLRSNHLENVALLRSAFDLPCTIEPMTVMYDTFGCVTLENSSESRRNILVGVSW